MGAAHPTNEAAAQRVPRRADPLLSPVQPRASCPLLRRASALMAGLALAACATSHAKGDAPTATVQLTNDLTPPSGVTVYAVTSNGRQILGDVPPGAQQALQLPLAARTLRVRLIAQQPNGRAVSSQPIVVTSDNTQINWDLRSNSVWFPRVRP